MTAPECTCAMGAGNCGPGGCNCTTTIMDCAVHGNSEAGRAEREAVERHEAR